MLKHGAVLLALMAATTMHTHAQDVALKAAITRSHFQIDGPNPFVESLTATSLGGHARFRFGSFFLQPELHVVTRGGVISDDEPPDEVNKRQIRLEYLEVPVMVGVPVAFGAYEVFVAGGPMVALESRCRYIYEVDDLRTNVGCDPPTPPLFSRPAFDYGLTAGAGISRSLGGGRILVEGRYTWGMNDIRDDSAPVELRNRTFMLLLGYVVSMDEPGN